MIRTVRCLAAVLLVAACGAKGPPPGSESAVAQGAPNAGSQRPAFAGQTRIAEEKLGVVFRVETAAQGLEHPWGLQFLPDGRMLVTERPGRLRYVALGGALSEPIAGVPAVLAKGQAGLLDVALDPDFTANSRIYLSYVEPRPGGAAVAIARAELAGQSLANLKVIFRAEPVSAPGTNYGSRLVFARDGTLFASLGDRIKARAQSLAADNGKIIRITTEGEPAPGNPLAGRAGARPEIWSWGHRNPQGMALDPATGELWAIEHGARGGDEINIPRAGRNYGWPVITYGVDYTGLPIGRGVTARAGMEQPLYYWDPVIAPSGMMFYNGEQFPAWKGSLFVGGMQAQALVRLSLDGGKVTGEEHLLTDLGERIRDVRQGPDGLIYVLTDAEDGRILRLVPRG